eukprot:9803000-Lingulodinium_polyedra.AAC.1
MRNAARASHGGAAGTTGINARHEYALRGNIYDNAQRGMRVSGRTRGNGRNTRETWTRWPPPGHTVRGMDVS